MRGSEFTLAAVVTVIASGCASLVAVHVARSTHRLESLEAHSLTIVDDANRPVVVLSPNNGSPGVFLYDEQQRKREELFLEPNGTPDLYLYDAAGTPRAALDLYDSGVPNLDFGPPKAPGQALELASRKEGEVELAFHDFQNKRITAMLKFHTTATGPALELINESGKVVWSTRERH